MLEIKNGAFFLDGKKTNIYSGAIHYFRVPQEYWEDRLLKLRAAGLNTVETYVPWNLHEPHEGEYCFEGMLDIEKFLETAQKLGLYAIVRPGPYICAEWDFGGFPAWLLKDENLRLRCFDKKYLSFVERYFKELFKKLVPHLSTNGGNVIALQVENEYGSFGRDKKYLYYLRDLMKSLGADVQLFTSDGETRSFFSGGGIPEEFMVANFGNYNDERFDDLKILQPDKPLMCGEHWCGWFDQWGKPHHRDDPKTLGKSLDGFFKENASFNLYMFHGGTNFGFTAGANYYDKYTPTITSYDYGAPLSENGAYTEKYFILREKMAGHLKTELPALPEDAKTQSLPKLRFKEFAPLFKNLKAVSVHKRSHLPQYMENYSQNSGLILYSTEIDGSYRDTTLKAFGVHDIAYVYINGKLVHRYDRRKLSGKALYSEGFEIPIKAFDGKIKVDILVEALGRVNFDRRIYDRKGLKDIFIANQLITDFDVYCMEFNDSPKPKYESAEGEFPCFMRATFKAEEKTDCFIDMSNFKNCIVFVNGFNLGRILKEGPQRTLYLPGTLLKDENEITVLELDGARKPEISFPDHAIYKK